MGEDAKSGNEPPHCQEIYELRCRQKIKEVLQISGKEGNRQLWRIHWSFRQFKMAMTRP